MPSLPLARDDSPSFWSWVSLSINAVETIKSKVLSEQFVKLQPEISSLVFVFQYVNYNQQFDLEENKIKIKAM